MNDSVPNLSSQSEGEQPTSYNRLFLLDLLKAISITAVVSYHAVWVPLSTYEPHAMWVDVLFAPLRFCVPVLLTISFLLSEYGLVRRPDQSTGQLLQKRLMRLAIPTGFWFAIATGLKLATGNSASELIGQLLTGEIFTGAYYLLIMFQLTALFIGLRSGFMGSTRLFLILLAQGFVFLLIHAALLGMFGATLIPLLRSIDRPLVIYWFGYIALGMMLYYHLPEIVQRSRKLTTSFKLGMLVLTAVALLAEYTWLWHVTGGAIPPFDYLMFSCVGSVPVLFLVFASVAEDQIPVFLHHAITLLSKYSLGIFCLNGILSQIFLSLGSRWFDQSVFSLPEILLLKLVSWAILLSLSLGLSLGMARVGLKSVVC